jgi:hypothetical protein
MWITGLLEADAGPLFWDGLTVDPSTLENALPTKSRRLGMQAHQMATFISTVDQKTVAKWSPVSRFVRLMDANRKSRGWILHVGLVVLPNSTRYCRRTILTAVTLNDDVLLVYNPGGMQTGRKTYKAPTLNIIPTPTFFFQ